MFLAKVPELGAACGHLGHRDEAVTRLHAHMLPDRLVRAKNVVSIALKARALPTAAVELGETSG